MNPRRFSRALMAAVAEANPRRRSIGPSHAERQRSRRAEDRDLPVHPFDEENTYVTSAGERKCRACGRENARRRRQRVELAS